MRLGINQLQRGQVGANGETLFLTLSRVCVVMLAGMMSLFPVPMCLASETPIIESQGPSSNTPGSPTSRTNRSHVVAVMALLATFDDAGALPPEGTAQANQIIHALIQLQSVLVKSADPDLQSFLVEALGGKTGDGWEEVHRTLLEKGLTSLVVEALVTFAQQSAIWERPALVQAFQQFNVTEADWRIMETTFLLARDEYATQGSSIHKAYSTLIQNKY